jgi:ribonuclease D
MVASRILGYNAVGLGSVLDSVFGLKLDKRYQQANWGLRPLIPAMIEYARYDVHYLIALRTELKARLQAAERLPLASEDFTRLCQVQPSRQEPYSSTDMVWRVAGQQELTPTQAAILKELIEYRENYARAHNLPSYKVLGNQHLLDVALCAPADLVELAENCDISLSLIDRHGRHLVEAVVNGLKAAPIRRPSRHRPDSDYLDRLETLRTWRKNTAQALKVESDVVLPRDIMEVIASQNPASPEALEESMTSIPWRYQTFGSLILNQLNLQPS